MIKNLNGEFEGKKSLIQLSRIIGKNKEALLQILLSLSKKETFNRIICCPRYPVIAITPDLEKRLQLLNRSLSGAVDTISDKLAYIVSSVYTINRKKAMGQYFTPHAVADEAVKLLSVTRGDSILDPGCGTGVFPTSILRKIKSGKASEIGYLGVEIDPILVLATAITLEIVGAPSTWRVLHSDYLKIDLKRLKEIGFLPNKIVSNPPFVRVHRLNGMDDLKKSLELSGFRISSHSGLHSFFLAHSARLIRKGAMVFILPLEMDRAIYGSKLLRKIEKKYHKKKRGIGYNTVENEWYFVEEKCMDEFYSKLVAQLLVFETFTYDDTSVEPKMKICQGKPDLQLGEVAIIHRGLSTGANHFFLLSEDDIKKNQIPKDYIRRVFPPRIQRDTLHRVFTTEDWENLRVQGRPCWLLYIPREIQRSELPSEVRQYIKFGERKGVNMIPTCINRKPWYSFGDIKPPEIVFTYSYRDKPKFVLNMAQAINLTNFIGIFIDVHNGMSMKKGMTIVDIFNKQISDWISCNSVGRRYVGGLVNIGPGDLCKMPIPRSVIEDIGIISLERLMKN